jgi:hypothetical protein
MVGGQQVRPVVADDHRRGGNGVEGPLQAQPHSPLVAATAGPHGRASAVGGLGEVEQVGAFGFVKLESAGDRVQDGGGDAGESAAFQLRVVLDADPGEGGDLPATQARHSAAAHLGQDRLLRGEIGSPCDQELAYLGAVVHSIDATPDAASAEMPHRYTSG